MSERITIKSIFREYYVDFIDDFTAPLQVEIDAGGFLIIDAAVFDLYEERIKGILPKNGYVVIGADEHNKSIDKSKEIIEILVERGFRRNQKLVAMGGGIIQDVTAFSASITYRGVEWVFFPTTLLAQADSCIGSKTSINLGDKKNLIGNFYPPSRIYVDTQFIESLSVDDVKSGIGEMMHFYLYSNSACFNKLLREYDKVISSRDLLLEYIRESLTIKKAVIERDEFDRGERNKFNYGHTFGHAIETVTDYAVRHGQAVTVGMDVANYLSHNMGLMEKNVFDELHAMLSINFPRHRWERFDIERYLHALSKDKKNVGDSLVCILSEGPGRLIKKQVRIDGVFKDLIGRYFSLMAEGITEGNRL